MVTGYLESIEGQKAFAAIEQPYPKSVQDELYDIWLRDTDTERLSEFSRHKEKEVTQIIRVRTLEGKEFLTYSFLHYRLDKALNVTHRWQPHAGKFPIPEATYYVERLDFGKEQRKFKEITNIQTGYNIPYTPEKVDEIRKMGIPADGKMQYLLQTENGSRIAVKSYNDFRNGQFDELAHFGRIPGDIERKMWHETEGGPDATMRKIEEFKIAQQEERELPSKMTTVREVKTMIEEATTATSKNTEAPVRQHKNKTKRK